MMRGLTEVIVKELQPLSVQEGDVFGILWTKKNPTFF